PIGVATTVIRMKDCRMRNETRCRRLSLFRSPGVRSRASSLGATVPAASQSSQQSGAPYSMSPPLSLLLASDSALDFETSEAAEPSLGKATELSCIVRLMVRFAPESGH